MKTSVVSLSLFLSMLFCSAGNPLPKGFIIAPYLLEITKETAVVGFQIERVMPAKVILYEDNIPKEFLSPAGKTHFVRISGLKPGKSYPYRVVCGDGRISTPVDDDNYRIRTSGLPGETFTFAVYGDPRPGEIGTTYYHDMIIRKALQYEPSFCLILGDLVDDGRKVEKWIEFFNVESPLASKCALYPVLGDDDYEDGEGIFRDYFPLLNKGYYRFEWSGIQFFGLHAWDAKGKQDRASLDMNSDQMQWLKGELEKEDIRQAPFRVVFMHDPVYISRGRPSEVLFNTWAPLFEKYNIDVVFASYHLYERSLYKGVTYIISGGAGAEIIWLPENPSLPSQAAANKHHFCSVDVNSNSLTIKAIANDGTVLDKITLCPKSISPEQKRYIERLVSDINVKSFINEGHTYPDIPVYLFGYHDCEDCQEVINHVLPNIALKHQVSIVLNYFDLGKPGAYDLFLNAGAEFGKQNADIPALFIGRKVLGGKDDIASLLEQEILQFKKDTVSYKKNAITPFTQAANTKSAKKINLSLLNIFKVIVSGFYSGVCPCALSSIVFLILWMILLRNNRKNMRVNGRIFIVVFFIVFILNGFLFYLVSAIFNIVGLSVAVNIILLAVVVIFLVLQFLHLLRNKRNTMPEKILPLPLLASERLITSAVLKTVLIMLPVISGMIFSLMALACTGQVYINLVSLLNEPENRIIASGFLLLYGLAYSLPLLAAYIITAFFIASAKSETYFRGKRIFAQSGVLLALVLMALSIIFNWV